MKKVALNNIHESKLKAKMVEFADYWMPVRYSSDKEEHLTVRNGVGVFDVSHMGEFLLSGENALNLITKVTSNNPAKLYDGKVQYSCLPNEQGGIVDDLLVYRMSETEYMLVVNASNIEKDWNWIKQHNEKNVEMKNISDETSLFAVQGPKATETLQKLTEVNLSAMEYYTFKIETLAGVEEVIISATGYTGAGGFELYVKNKDAEKVWNAVFEAGEEFDIKPIGLGARDTLRLEKGFCLYGNDINDTTSPLEAGLGWITKFKREIPFINYDELKEQKAKGVQKKLLAFKMKDKGIPRQHYEILNTQEEKIGEVTSGTISPVLNIGIGMGYISTEYATIGTEIFVKVRNKLLKAEVIKLPFV